VTAISKRRIGNYILYAIGEIVLVVVGILIALWFNGRKEKERLQDKTQQTASLIVQLMETNQVEIKEILDEWAESSRVLDTILYETELEDPIPRSCEECAVVLTGFSLPTLSNRVPTTISNTSLADGPIRDKLTEIEFYYQGALESTSVYDSFLTEYINQIMLDWQSNREWFTEFVSAGECNDECQDYFYNSKDYRTKAAYFNLILIDGYYFQLQSFYYQNVKYIKELNALLGIETSENETN